MGIKWSRPTLHITAILQVYPQIGSMPLLHHSVFSSKIIAIERLSKGILRVLHGLLSERTMPAKKDRLSIAAVQKVIKILPLRQLSEKKAGNLRYQLEVLTGLILLPMFLRSMSMKTYCTLQAINKEKVRRIVDVARLLESLELVHKEVPARSKLVFTRTQQGQKAQTKVLSGNIKVRDSFMV